MTKIFVNNVEVKPGKKIKLRDHMNIRDISIMINKAKEKLTELSKNKDNKEKNV